MSNSRILLVGGGTGANSEVSALLDRRRYPVSVVEGTPGALTEALRRPLEAVVLLLPTPGALGRKLVELLTSVTPAPAIIVVGTDESIPNASTAFSLGAQDFVPNREDDDRLCEAVELTLGRSRRDSELRYFRDRAAQSTNWRALVGSCEAMQRALHGVKQVVGRAMLRTTPPILVTGETGTGKGLVARCIHFNSARRHEPYVDVNCAALPAALIEAELMGHERGAFTDARVARAGLFETADGGTLFLDEIAALRVDLQAKLLTITEEKRVRRIGGREHKQVNVQIIAATHRDLADMVEKGQFREDLYHRLNVIRVELPPLRERGEDKVHLAQKFVEQMCAEYGLPVRDITPEAEQLIREHDWPGNVRELRNQIEQIILVADDFEIRPEHFNIVRRKTSRVEVKSRGRELEIRLPDEGISLEALERTIIKEALKQCDGNVSRTARFLAISRQTLIYRLKKHELATDNSSSA